MDGKKPEGRWPGGNPVPGGATGRLPSFKKKRDLTLGEAKKKFVPNLSVQRIKKEDPIKTASSSSSSSSSLLQSQLKLVKPKQEEGRSGPHQRSRPELIQTTGAIFSDGLAGDGGQRRRAAATSSTRAALSSKSESARPRRGDLAAFVKSDKDEEERRRKALLQDDFISDQEEGLFVPVQLPMINTGKVFKEKEHGEEEEEEEEEEEVGRKLGKKKKKLNVIDSDDDDDDVAIRKEATSPAKGTDSKIVGLSSSKEVTFQDLLKQPKGDLIFIQLPDHLPGTITAVKMEGGTEGGSSKKKKEGKEGAVVGGESRLCTLRDLPEGYLGKIQVRKSGRTQLLIGQNAFDIELGTQVGFLQDLVSVQTSDIPQEVGDMTVLGHVNHRLVVTPDWEGIISRADPPLENNS